jgi:acyl-CoA reductase-like NAD-dependent aldehyde dehydrogenase
MHMSADIRKSTSKRLFIGGDRAGAEGGRTFEDRDPFTGDAVNATAFGAFLPPDSEFAQTETFGPVAAIEIVDSAGSHPFPF